MAGSEVSTKVSPVAWPLLGASGILAAITVLAPGRFPAWLLLVPLAAAFVESLLILPFSVLVARTGVEAAKDQLHRLRKLEIYEELLDKLVDEENEQSRRRSEEETQARQGEGDGDA